MKNHKLILLILATALTAVGLTSVLGQAGKEETAANGIFPLTLKDDLGYEVLLESPPQRMISLAPSNTEILCSLGLEDRLVAVTTFCNWPPFVGDKPKIGGMVDFSVEQIIVLDADFVFAVRGNPAERLRRLQQVGIPVYAFDCGSLDDILSAIGRVGLICGVGEKADGLVQSLRERIAAVRSSVAGVAHHKRVYIGSLQSPYYTAGRGSFLDELIQLAGGENIARVAWTRWPVLSPEQILVGDPEAVFAGLSYDDSAPSTQEILAAFFQKDPIWSKTTAGRRGALFVLDQDSLHRPGPRVVEAVEQLARALYPERFSGVESKH